MERATDEVLVRRVARTGDGRALSELYERYGGLVYAAGVRYLGDRTLAEDLVQDVFFSVWRNAASFDPSKASFSTWVYRVARNRAVDLVRRRGARVRTAAAMGEGVLPEPEEGGPERILETFDVVGALAQISPAHREILVLAYFEGLSQRDISRRTDTPLGTVKSRTTAALRALNGCSPRRRRTILARTPPRIGGIEMGERRREPNGHLPEEHPWAGDLLGPYVLGALDSDEERVVERHLARCAACREEERRLHETHEQLAGASVAVFSAPPDLKARILAELPSREDGEAASGGTTRSASRFASWASRTAAAAAAVLLLIALAAVAYSAGFFDRTIVTATLAPTELAPGAGGELEVRNSGPNAEASLEIWGLPQNEPDEYYELWLGKDGGRVSCGTFTVDPEGRGRIYASVPYASALELDDYQRVGITLEKFPEEPRINSARVVLRGDLQET